MHYFFDIIIIFQRDLTEKHEKNDGFGFKNCVSYITFYVAYVN